MPGELGDEEQGVGYYERRFSPDDSANMPVEPMDSMRKKTKNVSVMKVLRDHIKAQESE